ncbi:hypothetical protein F5051DRAFT_170772 [Lentinula edodes]|nr:hypothetical protein F5051DRAFT_170772 [Lentinula edodes]
MWTPRLSVLLIIISTILLGVLSSPVPSPAYPSFAGLERRVGPQVRYIGLRLRLVRRVLKNGELSVLGSNPDLKVDKDERWGICIEAECFELTLNSMSGVEVYHEFMRPKWKNERRDIPITDLGAKVNWGLKSMKVAVVNEFKHTAYGSHDDLGFLNDVVTILLRHNMLYSMDQKGERLEALPEWDKYYNAMKAARAPTTG